MPCPSLIAAIAVLWCVAAPCALAKAGAGSSSAVATAAGPPSFFVRDRSDGQCLAGGEFKRCGIDTLWFVEGKAGAYKIHRRLVDEMDLEECLDKTHCHTEDSPARLSNCNHCGAQKWNILGDDDTGYYITQDRERYCLRRVGDSAHMSSCEERPERFNVKFATRREINAMGSDGARLVLAAADGDLDAVMGLLQRKVSPNARDWEQRTPLLAAAASGNVEMLRYLVGKKADVQLSDRDDVTPLAEAVMGGHTEAVRFLLSLPAVRDVLDAPAASGASPLWFAAAEGRAELLRLLLEAGAAVDAQRLDGITPLIAAAAGGHEDCVSALLEGGADVQHRTAPEGLTALLAACEHGSLPLVRALVDAGAAVDTLSVAGFSPLIVAAANGFTDIARLLLARGADPELPHPESITALMYAAAGGHLDTARLLLEPGPDGRPISDVNRRHRLGGCALMEAATKGVVDVYRLLVSHGADPSVTDRDGVTVLMTAASHGRDDLIRAILAEHREELDVDRLSDSGGTALMYAAGGGHASTCALLVSEGGADLNALVKASPAYLARVQERSSNSNNSADSTASTMIEVDEVEHSDGGTALTVAAEGGFADVARVLVEAGADIHVVAEDNHTALTYSFARGHSDIVELLLRSGADPNSKYTDSEGETHDLLLDSIVASNASVAVELITRGAALDRVDADGADLLTLAASLGLQPVVAALLQRQDHDWLPMHTYLVAAASEGHVEVAELLLSRADCLVNGADADGSSALMAAAARGHRAVVDRLLRQSGVLVDLQNVDGHSALMFANNGMSQVFSMFDELKAYMNDSEEDGARIMRRALGEYESIIEMLLGAGADPALKDNEGHIAADFNVLVSGGGGDAVESVTDLSVGGGGGEEL